MLRRSISKYTKETLQFFGQPITFLLRQQTMMLLLAVAITESAFSSSAMTLNYYFVSLKSLNQLSTGSFEFPIILTVYYLISLSTASFFGSLSDRIGRRTLLIFGTTLAGISFVPFPLIYPLYSDYTPSFLLLALANAAKGLAAAMVAGPVLAMFADISQEKNHGETMGKFYLAKSAGAASGFLLGGITWAIFQQDAFYFFMIVMLGATFLYVFRFKEPRRLSTTDIDTEQRIGNFQELLTDPGSINPFKTVLNSLKNKQFQKFAIAWLAYSTLVGAAVNYITPLFLFRVQVGSEIIGFVFLVGAGVMGLIQPTIGKLSDSIGRKPFLIIGCLGMSLLVVMISSIINLNPSDVVELIFNPLDIIKTKSLEFVPGIPIKLPHLVIVLFLLVFLLCASSFASSSLGLIADVTEEGNRGREMGLTQAITSSGSILGTSVGGWFWGISGILGVMTFCFGLSLIAVIIIIQFLYETSGFYHFTHKLV